MVVKIMETQTLWTNGMIWGGGSPYFWLETSKFWGFPTWGRFFNINETTQYRCLEICFWGLYVYVIWFLCYENTWVVFHSHIAEKYANLFEGPWIYFKSGIYMFCLNFFGTHPVRSILFFVWFSAPLPDSHVSSLHELWASWEDRIHPMLTT